MFDSTLQTIPVVFMTTLKYVVFIIVQGTVRFGMHFETRTVSAQFYNYTALEMPHFHDTILQW